MKLRPCKQCLTKQLFVNKPRPSYPVSLLVNIFSDYVGQPQIIILTLRALRHKLLTGRSFRSFERLSLSSPLQPSNRKITDPRKLAILGDSSIPIDQFMLQKPRRNISKTFALIAILNFCCLTFQFVTFNGFR